MRVRNISKSTTGLRERERERERERAGERKREREEEDFVAGCITLLSLWASEHSSTQQSQTLVVSG